MVVMIIHCQESDSDFKSLQVQEMVGKIVEKGPNYVADPSGLRIGNPPDEKMAEILQQEASKLEEYISKVNYDWMLSASLLIDKSMFCPINNRNWHCRISILSCRTRFKTK